MKVRYILTIKGGEVMGKSLGQIEIDWEEEATPGKIIKLSRAWLTQKDFLLPRMPGLSRVEESSLTIEPID